MKYSGKVNALLFLFSMIFVSCEKQDPIIPNEEEIITTLKYILTPADGGAEIVFLFRDLDGDGGNPPTIIEPSISKSSSYNGRIELLNELTNPIKNISDEVFKEGEDHQFFYVLDPNAFTLIYHDFDANGKPIGLLTKLQTFGSGNYDTKITLRHKPNKSALYVSEGFIDNAGGETDIEVTFKFNVK